MNSIARDLRVVQLYEVVRSAHLERAAAVEPRPVILYRRNRYDFDPSLVEASNAQRRGLWRSIVYALSTDVDIVEVNEPLSGDSSLPSVLFIAAARFRAALRRRPRPLAVSYAIENFDPDVLLRNLPPKARIRHRLRHLATPILWRSLDRIVYGTAGARAVYGKVFGETVRRPVSTLIEALPAPAGGTDAARDPIILFLGDLSERKGFLDVVAAWPGVRSAVPHARLLIVGRGAGSEEAAALAASDEMVTTVIDPPRANIAQLLGEAKVLALPSRRRPLWREQVGLPIVEGLAAGCLVVTTTETGIADWLSCHGHWVIPEPEASAALGAALIEAVGSSRDPADVRSDLPRVDGRQAAHEWMHRVGDPTGIG
ncbi:glycosyltransferase family 4 protein [Microbacterium sp. 1P06AB]|uniref:glycosyltransferase family 4 protein n=1 Tax=Microbacterium sp. 1P06AB TaxID=3132289 RepID=UPI0039A61274